MRKTIARLAKSIRSGQAIPMFAWRALDRAVDDEVERERRAAREHRYTRVRLRPWALPEEITE
jgi:hypothetical protein